MDEPAGQPVAEKMPGGDFSFTGTWTEFLPIALTNFLLTIVTLGIYRFWATARQRRYLWSRTHFIDDAFEWTGTGFEMFKGFLVVFVILIPTLLILNFGIQALVLRGQWVPAVVIALLFYLGLFYLINTARFRAIRYRLSRSYWHGIRGGSDDGGWDYGWSASWKMAATIPTLGLLVPWVMTRLWNERWGKMSFGSYPFQAEADSSGIFMRWLLIYLGFIGGLIVVFIVAIMAGPAIVMAEGELAMTSSMTTIVIAALLLLYVGIPILLLSYYAAYFRKVASATSLGDLQFEFTARTKDWLLLFLGNIGLAIITLGVGLLFIPYRNWKFLVLHLHAHGDVDFAALTQSTTRAPGEAEGLADMFDPGAI